MGEWMGRLHEKVQQSMTLEDMNPHWTHVEIEGAQQLSVENHQGILQYGDTEMGIVLTGMQLWVTGQKLDLRVLTVHELPITGQIERLEYRRIGEAASC